MVISLNPYSSTYIDDNNSFDRQFTDDDQSSSFSLHGISGLMTELQGTKLTQQDLLALREQFAIARNLALNDPAHAEAPAYQFQMLIDAIEHDPSGGKFIATLSRLADQESLSGLGNIFKKIGSAISSGVKKVVGVVKSVAPIVASVAPGGSSVVDSGSAISNSTPSQYYQYIPEPEEKKDKTLLYVGIAAAGVLAISAVVILSRRPQQPVQIHQIQPAPQLSGSDDE